MQLNGVVLLSSILNYGRRSPGFDQEMVNYIPTYAAIAAYHHRANPATADMTAYLGQVRAWAQGPYANALAQGQMLPDAQRQAIATQLAAYTGLPVQYVLDADLRVDPGRFRKALLRDQRLTLGRYDARFTGMDVDAASDTTEYDPSDTGITGAFRLELPSLSCRRSRLPHLSHLSAQPIIRPTSNGISATARPVRAGRDRPTAPMSHSIFRLRCARTPI